MFGDMGKMMKQVSEMKSKMKDAEKELNALVVKGASADNKVEVEVSGKMDLKSLKIDPELIATNDVKKIEKSVFEAVDSAIKVSRDTAASKLGAVTGGMKIPGLT
jgi:nucleoid-associated protein EbfC